MEACWSIVEEFEERFHASAALMKIVINNFHEQLLFLKKKENLDWYPR